MKKLLFLMMTFSVHTSAESLTRTYCQDATPFSEERKIDKNCDARYSCPSNIIIRKSRDLEKCRSMEGISYNPTRIGHKNFTPLRRISGGGCGSNNLCGSNHSISNTDLFDRKGKYIDSQNFIGITQNLNQRPVTLPSSINGIQLQPNMLGAKLPQSHH